MIVSWFTIAPMLRIHGSERAGTANWRVSLRADCPCEGHLAPGLDVGGNRAKRRRQLVEVLDVRHVGRQAVEVQIELLTLDESGRHENAARSAA